MNPCGLAVSHSAYAGWWRASIPSSCSVLTGLALAAACFVVCGDLRADVRTRIPAGECVRGSRPPRTHPPVPPGRSSKARWASTQGNPPSQLGAGASPLSVIHLYPVPELVVDSEVVEPAFDPWYDPFGIRSQKVEDGIVVGPVQRVGPSPPSISCGTERVVPLGRSQEEPDS